MDRLIVFIKNPVLGKVKTRLAATIGNEKALEIYKQLLQSTLDIVSNVNAEIHLFFSDEIMEVKNFNHLHLQNGNNLGERMKNAFLEVMSENDSTLIIGTDCPDISEALLTEAYSKLKTHDVVIGPAKDGGYYLLGMKNITSELFENIIWSTDVVLQQSIKVLEKNKLTFCLLDQLSDIDTENDLIYLQRK